MLKKSPLTSNNFLTFFVLGVSFFGSSVYASNTIIEVEETSKKRPASGDFVRQDDPCKKTKKDLVDLSPLEIEKRKELVLNHRNEAKKYTDLARNAPFAEKKLSSYLCAAQMCDEILLKMGGDMDISDVRNAAITHFNVAIHTPVLDAKIMSLGRCAYLFDQLMNKTSSAPLLQDVKNAAIAHYHVSKNTPDDEMKKAYLDRANELYFEANEIEINSFWNF